MADQQGSVDMTRQPEPRMSGAAPDGVLRGLTAVRARPNLYLRAADDRGVADLVGHILDFSFSRDKKWSGNATWAVVTLMPDGGITVSDDGLGLPTDMVDGNGKLSWAPVLTALIGDLYIVNAFSEQLIAEVHHHGKLCKQEFHGDEWMTCMTQTPESADFGFRVTFWPLESVFGPIRSVQPVIDQLTQFSADHPRARVTLRDERHSTYAEPLVWGPRND